MTAHDENGFRGPQIRPVGESHEAFEARKGEAQEWLWRRWLRKAVRADITWSSHGWLRISARAQDGTVWNADLWAFFTPDGRLNVRTVAGVWETLNPDEWEEFRVFDPADDAAWWRKNGAWARWDSRLAG